MTSLHVKDTNGQTLTFRGTKFCSQESGRVETGQGAIWYELEAYDRDNGEWVLKITANRRELDYGEIVEYCNSGDIGTIEDFLYDFDPSRILPQSVLENARAPAHRSLIDAADRAYHAVVRRVFHQLTNRNQKNRVLEIRHQRVRPSDATLKVDTAIPGGIVNRIKRLFGVA